MTVEKITLKSAVIVNVKNDDCEPRQLVFRGILRNERANEAIARIKDA